MSPPSCSSARRRSRATCAISSRSSRRTPARMPSPSHSAQQSSTELRLRQELIAQARFLDGLVESLGAVSSTLGGSAVLERTPREAQRLFEADAAVVLTPSTSRRTLRPAASSGIALGPLADLSVDLDD